VVDLQQMILADKPGAALASRERAGGEQAWFISDR
jgi:hypothetical protein